MPAVSTTDARLEANAELGHDAADPVSLQRQVIHRLLEQGQIGLVFQTSADRLPVEHTIGLGPGGAHRRALARIEDAKLDPGLVGRRRHRPAQGIDLLHQVALADAADGRVARHLAQGLDVVGQQQSAAAHARRRERRLGAGVAATDNDDVITGGIAHGASGSGLRRGEMIRHAAAHGQGARPAPPRKRVPAPRIGRNGQGGISFCYKAKQIHTRHLPIVSLKTQQHRPESQ